MEKCKICNLDFKGMRGIANHIRRSHHIPLTKDYYDSFIKKDGEGICIICGGLCNFIDLGKGYSKRCSYSCLNKGKKSPRKGKKSNIKCSEETRLKMKIAYQHISHPKFTFKG